MEGFEGFASLLALRPHLGLALKGCYEGEMDGEYLLAQLQENEDERIAEENNRRKEEMERLMKEEELDEDRVAEIRERSDLQPLAAQQIELPEQALNTLARHRAEIIRDHLIIKLNIPSERLTIEEIMPCGTRVDLVPSSVW